MTNKQALDAAWLQLAEAAGMAGFSPDQLREMATYDVSNYTQQQLSTVRAMRALLGIEKHLQDTLNDPVEEKGMALCVMSLVANILVAHSKSTIESDKAKKRHWQRDGKAKAKVMRLYRSRQWPSRKQAAEWIASRMLQDGDWPLSEDRIEKTINEWLQDYEKLNTRLP